MVQQYKDTQCSFERALINGVTCILGWLREKEIFHIIHPLVGGVCSIKRSGGCRLRLEQHRGGGSALDCVEELDESSRIGVFLRA